MKNEPLPPLETYFGSDKSSAKRPALSMSPPKERSFYQGAFAKGSFEIFPKSVKESKVNSPLGSPLVSPVASPKLSFNKQPSSILNTSIQKNSTFYGTTSSYNSNRALEIDPEIVHEFPYKNDLILRNPPKKLQKLLEITNPTKSTRMFSPKKEHREKKEKEIPGLNSYLSFLGTSNSKTLTNFATKMHKKSGSYKAAEKLETQTSRPEDQLYETLAFHRKNISMTLRLPKDEEVVPAPVLEEASSPIELKKEWQSGLEETERSEFPRSSLLKNPSLGNKKLSIILTDGKNDEILAKELTDEVVNNYKIYMASASNSKDLEAKMTHFLKTQEVLEVFTGRLNKYMPLPMRIFRDMTELVEEKSNKIDRVTSSDMSPILKPKKSSRPAAKLIPAKYHIYKSISQELVNVTSQFRLLGLRALEGRLFQSHEAFKQRKNDVLRSLSKWNTKKFENIKNECEGVEDMLFLYENYDLKDKLQGANKINREAKSINHSLNGFMINWKRALTNTSIAEE